MNFKRALHAAHTAVVDASHRLARRLRLQANWQSLGRSGRVLDLAQLEERVLLSASPVAAAARTNGGNAGMLVTAFDLHNDNVALVPITGTHDSESSTSTIVAPAHGGSHAALVRRELVIVDSDVKDVERLLADLRNTHDAHRELNVVVVDSERNGIEQISDILAQYQRLDAVHLVTQGNDEATNLGGAWLSNEDVAAHRDEIAGWKGALADKADLLFYGSNLAGDRAGRALLNSVRDLTGADVAASRDATGSRNLGGDWKLEYRAGHAESPKPLSQLARKDWTALLSNTGSLGTDGASLTANGDTPDRTESWRAGTESTTPRQELVFVDTGVHNYQQLVDDLVENDPAGRLFTVVRLDSNRDGLQQISQTLAGFENLDAVHVVSHGTEWGVNLGTTWLTSDSLAAYGAEIAGWDHALAGDADLLFYGCNLAYDAGGQALLQTIGELSGADVAASIDHTGNAQRGGDWDLEFASGQIETTLAFSAGVQQIWTGLLSVATFQQGTAGYAGTQDAELDESDPNNPNGTGSTIQVDLDNGGGESQGLIRFDNIFGNGANQIPLGSVINSATLTVAVTGTGGNFIDLHRMLVNWSEASTWNSMAFGIQRNNVEANAAADSMLDAGAGGSQTFTGLAATVQAWSDGATNYGWALFANSTNGWDFRSSENGSIGQRPILTVDWATPPGITVNPTAGLTTTEAGGTATFDVVLDTAPTADVTIGISSSDLTEGTVSASSLTFTLANWNVVQTVTVTGADDFVDDGNIGYSIVTAAASSADPGYNGLNASDVSVTNTDDDTAGITVSGISGNTTEAGGAATFTVVLNSQPTADVTVGLSSSDTTEGTVAPASVTFTAANWNVAQTVTVTGADDLLDDGDLAYTIVTAAATSADANYNGLNAANVSVTNMDDDTYNTLIVTTTSDAADGDTSSIAALVANMGADGRISLREAILATNNTANGVGGADRIYFNIPDALVGGAHTIVVSAGGLPSINDAVVIDGATEPDFGGSPIIELNGASAGGGVYGLTVNAAGSTIRGLVINRFGGSGIALVADGNLIEGNYVGINVAGTVVLGNGIDGVEIFSNNNTIGGVTAAARNVLSGNNDDGIEIDSTSGNLIQGNYIGLNAAGTAALGNQSDGVLVNNAVNNTIGGTAAGAGNTIAFNGGIGIDVQLSSSTGNSFLGNSIYSNVALGIDLNTDGVTANDLGDGDPGANGLQNFPVLTSAATTGSQVTISGTFNSTASTTFRIEFFSAGTIPDATGFGEGNTYLGATSVVTAGSGNASFNVTLAASVTVGEQISATATVDLGGGNYGDTSEFAQNVATTAAPGIVVSAISGNTSEAGGSATFTVVLFSQPTADVTIGLSSSDTTEGTVGLASVTFTSANWNVAQIVTVTGVDDLVDDGDIAYTIVTAAAASADASYNGLDASDVAATNTDDDTAGIIVTPSVVAQGSEFRANTTTTGSQVLFEYSDNNIAMDAAGNFIIVWDGYSADGSDSEIYAQRFAVDGAPLGGEFVVNTTTAGYQYDVSVAMDAAGNFVIAWESENQDGSGNGIYAQRFHSAGVAQGSEFLVNTTTAGNQGGPSLAMDAAGSFVVVWQSAGQDGSGLGVYGQRFAADGTTLGGEFQVNTYTASDQRTADVAMTATGEFVVAWASLGQDGSGWGIYAQRYDAAGTPQGGEFQVNSYTTGNQGAWPSVSMNDAGRFIIAWQSDGQDGSGLGAFAQLYDAAGVAQGSEIQLSVTTLNNQEYPIVAMDAAGNFVAVWSDNGALDGSGRGAYARHFDSAGNPLTGEFLLNTTTAGDQYYPVIAMDDAGNFVVAWDGNGSGDADGIFAQRFGAYTTEAGGTAAFTVVLNAQPTADVTIAISSSDPSEGTVSVASLTFTAANWNVPQTVTVTGVDDFVDDGYVAYSIVTGPATSGDAAFNGLDAANVALTNFDDDTAGITVTPTSGLVTDEDGGTASFTVVLDSQPTADVTIAVSSSDTTEGTVSVSPLTFTAANWNVAQTVTITGAADFLSDGDIPFTVVLDPATSADPSYNGRDPADVSVTNLEDLNDAPVNSVPGPQVTNEGSPLTFSALGGNQISISDVDAGPNPVQVTLTVSNGTITLNGTVGLAFTVGDGSADSTMTFTGAISDVNAALDGMVFDPNSLFYVPASLTITTEDLGSSGSGGPQSDTDTINITVNAVNDAPFIVVPAAQTTAEDTPLVFSASNGNLIVIDDLDAGPNSVALTLTAIDGLLTLASTSGLSFTTGNGSGDLTMTFTGTLADINAALDGLTYTPTANFNGLASLTVTVDDLGNVGSPGPLGDSQVVAITVTAVNDAPDASNDHYTLSDGDTLSVAAPGVLNDDTDVDGDPLTAALFSGPAHGTLTFNADGSFSYVAETTFWGTDSFKYQVSDGTDTAIASVTIDVTRNPVGPPTPPPDDDGDTSVVHPPLPIPNAPPSGQGGTPQDHGDRGTKSTGGHGSPSNHRDARPAANNPEPFASSVRRSSELELRDTHEEHLPGRKLNEGARRLAKSLDSLEGLGFTLDTEMLWQGLNSLRQQLASNLQFEAFVAGAATTVSSTLAAGYVFWTLRGGYMVAMVLSSLPAWRMMDPLPILETLTKKRKKKAEEEDDTLETMVVRKSVVPPEQN